MSSRKGTKIKRKTLYVKNPTAHRLAEQVSKRMGVTLSDAVISALEDKLKSTRRRVNRAKLDAITAKIAILPVMDSRSPDQILGYDEIGIPR